MFPETEQQASQMMATESNYYPPAVLAVHGDGVLAFFPSRSDVLTLNNFTPDPWRLLPVITAEKMMKEVTAKIS